MIQRETTESECHGCANNCYSQHNWSSHQRSSDVLGQYLIQANHAAFEVIVDVAVKEPCADIVRDHVCGGHAHRPNESRVHPHPVGKDSVSVPVGHVHIIFIVVGEQVPTNVLAAL